MELAIKGHATRGKEVIQLLEMLGGKSNSNVYGYNDDLYYFIAKDGVIYGSDKEYEELSRNYTILTLEEFEKLYPYKVGDRVRVAEYESKVCISNMYWDGWGVQYEVVTDEVEWYSTKELNEFNETNKEENYCQVTGNDTSSNGVNTSASLIIEETMEEKGTLVQIDLTREMNVNDEVEVILGDYEFVLKDGKTYFIKKKPRYPKDYEECCEVLGILDNRGFGFINLSECENILMSRFIQLKRCRDAYWKIAGEQMGLDKPWEPDWSNGHVEKYYIYLKQNEIKKSSCFFDCHFLAFPTAEMRDTFFENFKWLIKQCKELL